MESSRKAPRTDPLQACWNACVEDWVRPGQTLVVGLSGGLDSMSLLHWLASNLIHGQHRLCALHVHHNLSPNANDWADACQRACDGLAVPLSIAHVAVERGSPDGLEAAARRARHAAYAQVGGDWIVLAHHRGDQVETLLFNLLRGCGVRGAGAMRQRHGRLLRPWLSMDRNTILNYARRVGLHWIEDESNADVRFSRNFLRHRILPLLHERFPSAEERLAAAAGHFGTAQELLDDLARIDLASTPAAFPLPVPLLRNLSQPRALNLLAFLLRASGVPVTGESRLDEALRQFLTAGADRHPAISFGEHQLVRRRGMIELIMPEIDSLAGIVKGAHAI